MKISAKAKDYRNERSIFFGVYRHVDEGDLEDAFIDGAQWMQSEYEASALLSYCVKHKEFMCQRQSERYAKDVTGGCFIAKYADEGCGDFTSEEKVPYAYELGFSMSDLVEAQCDNKNIDDVICDLVKQIPDTH